MSSDAVDESLSSCVVKGSFPQSSKLDEVFRPDLGEEGDGLP